MQIKALQEAKNEANSVLMAGNKFLQQHQDILSAEELTKTKEYMAALAQQVEHGDKDTINKAMDDFNHYTRPFAEKAMDKTIKESLSGKKIG